MALTSVLEPTKTINTILSNVVAAQAQIPYEVLRQDQNITGSINTGGFLQINFFDASHDIVVGDNIFIQSVGYVTAAIVTASAGAGTAIITNVPYVVAAGTGYVNLLSGSRIDYRVILTINDAAGTTLLIPTEFRYQTQPSGRLFVDIKGLITPLLLLVNSLSTRVRMQEFWGGVIQGSSLLFDAVQSISAKQQAGHNGGSNLWDLLQVLGGTSADVPFTQVRDEVGNVRLDSIGLFGDMAANDIIRITTFDGTYNDIAVCTNPVNINTINTNLPIRNLIPVVGTTIIGIMSIHRGSILTKFKNPLVWAQWARTASTIIDSNLVARTGGASKYRGWNGDVNRVLSGTFFSSFLSTVGFDIITILETQKTSFYAVLQGVQATTNAATTPQLFYRVCQQCDRPIYIEWRNSLGALDQHLFSISQSVLEGTENDVSFDSPITEDLQTALSTVGKIIGNQQQRITVQADKLLIDQMQALSEIKTSDEVYVYLTKDGSSKVAVRASGGQAYNTKGRGTSFEVTIEIEFPRDFDIFQSNQYGLS